MRRVAAAPVLTRPQPGAAPAPPPSPPPAPPAPRPDRGRRTVPLLVTGLVAAVVSAVVATTAAVVVSQRVREPAALEVTRDRTPASTGAAGGSVSSVAARVVPSVVQVRTQSPSGTGTGSGFVIGDDLVVTNAHVAMSTSADHRVRFSTGRTVEAQVLGISRADDLAVLRVDVPAGVDPLPSAGPGTARVGDPVVAIGSPLGLAGTVTSGIVSAVDRRVRLGDARATAVQTDASINPGNSGGPLIDGQGRVIGMNTAIASLGGGNIGIGFAIPGDRVATVAERLARR